MKNNCINLLVNNSDAWKSGNKEIQASFNENVVDVTFDSEFN